MNLNELDFGFQTVQWLILTVLGIYTWITNRQAASTQELLELRTRIVALEERVRHLPDAVKDSRKDTIKLLETIRDGVVTLGMPSGQAAPEPGEVKVRSRRQQFGDDLWGRY